MPVVVGILLLSWEERPRRVRSARQPKIPDPLSKALARGCLQDAGLPETEHVVACRVCREAKGRVESISSDYSRELLVVLLIL